jgi:hypothetical protein
MADGGDRAAAPDGTVADTVSEESEALTRGTPPGEAPAHSGEAPAHSGEAPAFPHSRARRAPVLDSRRSQAAFRTLKWISLFHSCVYLGLLVCAFALGKPEPATFVLGLGHGLLWIFMSIACVIATRLRIVPLRLAVAVAVLGGIGPFFGSGEFLREQRRRSRQMTPR